MLTNVTTGFIARLRGNDEAAWYELWETFGPILRAQLSKWGKGRIGAETVRDLSQETLTALSGSIDRYDPSRGARFSTWLLAIAKHVLGDEMDKRMALKRGSGNRGASFEEAWMTASSELGVDEEYEAAVFRAKVEAALRNVEKKADFVDFSIFRMRVLDGMPGKDVAAQVGVSEPTISRRLAKIRDMLRLEMRDVIGKFSFTDEELEEAERNGVELNPSKADDGLFDEAISEICHKQQELRRQDEEAARLEGF